MDHDQRMVAGSKHVMYRAAQQRLAQSCSTVCRDDNESDGRLRTCDCRCVQRADLLNQLADVDPRMDHDIRRQMSQAIDNLTEVGIRRFDSNAGFPGKLDNDVGCGPEFLRHGVRDA